MMRFFLAGIMQGSHRAAVLHQQDYRAVIKGLLDRYLPGCQVYDPLADHSESLAYDDDEGRQVFFYHNRLSSEVDVLLAYVPEASMGTAIEMWQAYSSGRAVVTISPMSHNWAVRFLSHQVYADLEEFEAALASGGLAQRLDQIIHRPRRRRRPHSSPNVQPSESSG